MNRNRLRQEVPNTGTGSTPDQWRVAFEPGRPQVAEPERLAAEQWALAWMGRAPDAILAMGCHSTHRTRARARRVERLRSLRDALVLAGVPSDRIRYTGDDLAAPDSTDARCTVVIKALSATSLEGSVAPIRNLFADGAKPGSPACTSAS